MSRRKREQNSISQINNNLINEKASLYTPSKIETTDYIRPLNPHQKQFVKSIKQNQLTIGSGCPGTGKSILALFSGIQLINNPEYNIEKIVYVRASVETRDEKDIIGILPGEQSEKLSLLTYPIYDNCSLFLKKEVIDLLIEKEVIECIPYSLLRGRSFSNCLVIGDEIQNSGREGLKTLITRIGETSKLILIGDPDQCDIDPFKNGLRDLEWRLHRKKELDLIKFEETGEEPLVDFQIIKFDYDDIVRSKLTKFALDLYNI